MDFLSETTFPGVAAADPIGMLLQVLEDVLRLPTAADIVADDGVKHVAPIASRRSTFAHNLFDLVDGEPATVSAVEPVAAGWGCHLDPSLAAFAPDNGPAENLVDAGEFTDAGVERAPG